jgi:bleomycin hydrolase
MTRVLIVAALLSCLILSAAVLAQEASSHKVKYVPKRPDPAFQEMKERDRLAADERRAETQKIRDAHAELAKKREAEERELRFDFTGVEKPTSPDVFQSVFHFEPVRQYLTGTCWCFSTTSFLESELYRLTGKKIKLSEMHTVYYEFLEKARRYVAERGDSFFDEGSEGNAVLMIWRKYGAVPAADYKGELNPDGRYDHSEMTEEMKDYLAYVKEKNYWDEATVIASLRAIMDRHMGSLPERIVYDSKELTPKQFLDEVLGLDLDQYVALMSTLSQPFYEYGEYEVPGNWWHSAEYYNLPLEEFYEVIKYAIRNGYSVRLNGDVSEPGYNGLEDAAIIPEFDIPQDHIDQDSRELRFDNKTTSDDHDVHLVGYTAVGDRDWFLIKDSASSAQHGQFKGYYFYRDDYIKLKMLTIIVHKDAVKAVVGRFE